MMYYMTSKVFQDYYIPNEKRKDILKTQYVIVSTKVKIRDREKLNDCMLQAKTILYPDNNCFNKMDDKDDYYMAYFDQLEENKAFLATLIKAVIEDGYTIVFICTPKENKLNYLEMLSDYVYVTFNFPIYEYKKWSKGYYAKRKYKKKKIIKLCDEILKEKSEYEYDQNLRTEQGREKIVQSFKKLSKKELIKKTKKANLYRKGMSKSEMIDILEVFL